MNVATYNTRTISDVSPENLEIMIHELENTNWSVIGLSETKVKESKIETLQGSRHRIFLLFQSRSNGVGFLVHKKYVPLITDYKPQSDRLTSLTLKDKFSKIHFVQCYMPTSDKEDEEVEKIYDEIQTLIKDIPKRDHVFIMGDFNCKIGGLHINYGNFIGKHTLGKYNERGERLAQFCARNDLKITNSFFQKRKLCTWTSPDGKTKNQIDYILTRTSSTRLNVLDSSVLNKPDISDHKMVRTKVRLNFSWPKKEKSKPSMKVEQLKDLTKRDSFQLELHNRFSSLVDLKEPEEMYDNIVRNILGSAETCLDSNVNPYPKWMTEESKAAIRKKHDIRKENGPKSTQYREAKAKSKKLVKRDKLKLVEVDLDRISSLPPSQQYYAAIKKLKTRPRNIGWGIRSDQGELLTDKDAILQRWAEFYEKLYYDKTTEFSMKAPSDELIPSILKEEVENAIRKIKPGKSPGLDQIYTEYLKAGGETLVKALTNLFNRILVTGTVPTGFKEAMIVVIFKKGSMLDCSNYRPISLLSHVYKLFITVISLRVKHDLYNFLPSSQAAYQPGRGTIEQIWCMEQIIEKSLEFNNPTYITFIDFTKAFDSVHLTCLWSRLHKTNINERYITLLKETYDKSTAIVKTDIGKTRRINILKGVKQGDVLSAILFCIVIAAIQQQVEEECNSGISMGGHLISNLSYADDIAVVSNSVDGLQKYLDALSYHSSQVGLHINVAKTKCMSITKEPQQLQLKIYGKEIEEVSDFVYLGHKLSRINDGSVAVQHRISLGWAAFQNNKILLTSNRIPPKVKGKIYKTYILPVVLYGLDCVNWTSVLC